MLSQNNTNLREETLRASLYQFLGVVLNSYADPEQAIAVILEEITKVIAEDEKMQDFKPELIKPILKSSQYIMTTRYNKLLEDSKRAFGENYPIPVKLKLDNDKQLINLLDLYIKQL